MESKERVADRLRQAREKYGYTQQALVEALKRKQGYEVSVQTLQRYEAGKTDPTYHFLFALADLLDVSIDYLTGRSKEYDHSENRMIEEVTGLSNEAIEVMRVMSKSLTGFKSIELINHVFEIEYNKVREIRRGYGDAQTAFNDTIFSMMLDAITVSGAVLRPSGTDTGYVENVEFLSKVDNNTREVESRTLWRSYNITRVTGWLTKEMERAEGINTWEKEQRSRASKNLPPTKFPK